jgi:hypothetical protein
MVLFQCSIPQLLGDSSLACGGLGSCILSTGECDCYEGYTGTDCGMCDTGYAMVSLSNVPLVSCVICGRSTACVMFVCCVLQATRFFKGMNGKWDVLSQDGTLATIPQLTY